MKTYNEQIEEANGHGEFEPAPDARDFLGSAYLSKEDLNGEETVRLVNVLPEAFAGSTRRKLVASLDGYEKRLILNSTNIALLTDMFRTTNTAQWRGQVTLYVDPNVTYAGKRVGGIRVKSTRANAPESTGDIQ